MMEKETGIIEEGIFKYTETGYRDGKVILLLHGLMGTLSNFQGIVDYFSKDYNVVIPILPIFEMPLRKLGLGGLVKYVEDFVAFKEFDKVHVLGNSLGGHLAQLFTLANPDKVHSMILTGSSGLFENAMGSTFPKRGNYEYIAQKARDVFYDPDIASKEMIDDLYETVNDRGKAIRIVATAKSAIRHNLEDKLDKISVPTLLVWGKEDSVTPLFVGEKFNELIEGSILKIVDKCGHAPMMERPEEFNRHLEEFLLNIEKESKANV